MAKIDRVIIKVTGIVNTYRSVAIELECPY